MKAVPGTILSTILSLILGASEPAMAADSAATSGTAVASAATLPFHFDKGELTAMLAAYAKASGRKIIVDPGVRGSVSVYLPGEVTLDEAFNIVCDALALNGFSIVENGDTWIVRSARNAQRDMIPTVTVLPPPRPNRMMTMIFKLKHANPDDVLKQLRILPSKDGEMTLFEPTKQLIVSDYAANINRISRILETIDIPASANFKAPSRPAKKPETP